MARLRLTPQKREFFDLFTQASANAREIARAARRAARRLARDAATGLADIREAEHEGDRLTHEVINLLNRTFVTPLDRDDMYRLASAIDDVCDHIDEAADNIDLYEVKAVPARAQEQADVIYRAASRLHEAVELLEGSRRLAASSCTRCASSRTRATGSSREAIAELFRTRAGPAHDHPLEGHPRAARGSGRRLRERRRRARGDPRQEPLIA